MNKEELIKLLLKRFDIEGLVSEDLIDGLLKSALDKMVAESSNPYDDMAIAALYPHLAKAAKEAVKEFLGKLEQ
jgi:hypothetical protein